MDMLYRSRLRYHRTHRPADARFVPATRRRRALVTASSVNRTAFSYETQRLTKTLLTRQAVKTVLNYLSETNGQLHFFLHNYVSDHPLPLATDTDPDAWLAALAATPISRIADPRRSSVPSAAAAAAVTRGEREVSPREVAERVMALREHIALEMVEDLEQVGRANLEVRRLALKRSVSEFKLP